MFSTLKAKLYQWLTYEPPAKEILPFDFNRMKYEIRPGDVLLIEGRSRVSRIINRITQSPWTHAALYIGRLNDIEDDELQNIIHKHIETKPDTRLIVEDILDRGTVVSPLTEYRHHHIRICRPIGLAPDDVQLVIGYAIRGLGQPYNVRHLLDLARFLLPWSILPRRWGSSLFRTTTGETESGICSSLIAEAFSSVKFPILPYVKSDEEKGVEMFQRNPYLFTPKDFDYSPYFQIIKYPLFNPEELPYYRRLPWTKSDFLHHDNGILSPGVRKSAKPSDQSSADLDQKDETTRPEIEDEKNDTSDKGPSSS